MSERPHIRMTDIINLEYLEAIQNSLELMMGITIVILDFNGVPLSCPNNQHALCERLKQSEHGAGLCVETGEQLLEIGQKTRKPAILKCPNTGLRAAGVPIFFEEEFLGSWLIGQIRMKDVDPRQVEEAAEKAGISKAKVQDYLESLPVMDEAVLQNVLDLLTMYTRTLTDMVCIHTRLRTQSQELATMARRLEDAQRGMKAFMDLTNIPTCMFDFYSGEILLQNNACVQLLHRFGEGGDGESHRQNPFFSEFFKDKLIKGDGEPVGTVVWENYDRQHNRWWKINARAQRQPDGRLVVMTTILDISEEKAESERLIQLAYYHQSLDMPNVFKLNEDLKSIANEKTFLICFNVKGLSEINNAYGRKKGDALLKSIAIWLKSLKDLRCYCINGHSFAVLIKAQSNAHAMDLAAKLYERFSRVWTVDLNDIKQNLYIGVHMGVMQLCHSMESQYTLVDLFEQVISAAKSYGRLVLYDSAMQRELQEDVQLMLSLKKCILKDMEGFSLNYQPFVDVRTGKWVGVEALCRWDSPEIGSVSPEIFIKRAEQTGLIGLMSDWIFEEAIRQMKAFGLDRLEPFTLSMNLSAVQLQDRELHLKIERLLKKYDYPSNKLKLEITETAEVSFDKATVHLLEDICQIGISLALDDFGIGYATFSHIQNLPISVLKIDRSFVSGIAQDSFLQHTMKIMVEYAHSIHLQVLAEGVETKEELDELRQRGIDLVQGYYYSRPLPEEELKKQLIMFRM